jgi:hypothetical protein
MLSPMSADVVPPNLDPLARDPVSPSEGRLLPGVLQVLDLLADCGSSGASKNLKLGFATLLLNYAVLLTGQGPPAQDEDAQLQTLSGALEVATNAQQEGDQEALYRAMVAIGTLVRHLRLMFWFLQLFSLSFFKVRLVSPRAVLDSVYQREHVPSHLRMLLMT